MISAKQRNHNVERKTKSYKTKKKMKEKYIKEKNDTKYSFNDIAYFNGNAANQNATAKTFICFLFYFVNYFFDVSIVNKINK